MSTISTIKYHKNISDYARCVVCFEKIGRSNRCIMIGVGTGSHSCLHIKCYTRFKVELGQVLMKAVQDEKNKYNTAEPINENWIKNTRYI